MQYVLSRTKFPRCRGKATPVFLQTRPDTRHLCRWRLGRGRNAKTARNSEMLRTDGPTDWPILRGVESHVRDYKASSHHSPCPTKWVGCLQNCRHNILPKTTLIRQSFPFSQGEPDLNQFKSNHLKSNQIEWSHLVCNDLRWFKINWNDDSPLKNMRFPLGLS